MSAGVSEAGHAHEALQEGHAAADVLPGEQPHGGIKMCPSGNKSNLCSHYFSFPSLKMELI